MLVNTTSVTLGSIVAEFSKDDLQTLFDWIEKMSFIVESGVQSVGPASDYALVWEWGNARQTKKGPKTVKGKNPDGKSVWLSMQAPRGWISVNESNIWDAIIEEMMKVEFDLSGSEDSLKQELTNAYQRISERALEYLQQAVPVDSGDLYDSLEVVAPNDSILKEVESLSMDMVDAITGSLNI